MTTWTRMMIGEAVSDKAAGELLNIADAHLVEQLETYGATQARRLWEDGGRMVVIEITYADRTAASRYHARPSARQFVLATQHLLVGAYVHKFFESYDVAQLVTPPVAAR